MFQPPRASKSRIRSRRRAVAASTCAESLGDLVAQLIELRDAGRGGKYCRTDGSPWRVPLVLEVTLHPAFGAPWTRRGQAILGRGMIFAYVGRRRPSSGRCGAQGRHSPSAAATRRYDARPAPSLRAPARTRSGTRPRSDPGSRCTERLDHLGRRQRDGDAAPVPRRLPSRIDVSGRRQASPSCRAVWRSGPGQCRAGLSALRPGSSALPVRRDLVRRRHDLAQGHAMPGLRRGLPTARSHGPRLNLGCSARWRVDINAVAPS